MRTDTRPALRRTARVLALVLVLFVLFSAGPAVAAPPEGWPEAEPVSTLHVLLLLGGGPLALFAIISLLVYVPSMSRGETYTPGLVWRNEDEWFGGPRGGVQAVENIEREPTEGRTESERGGASARW